MAGIDKAGLVASSQLPGKPTPGCTGSEGGHCASHESVGGLPWTGDYPPTKGRAGGKLPGEAKKVPGYSIRGLIFSGRGRLD